MSYKLTIHKKTLFVFLLCFFIFMITPIAFAIEETAMKEKVDNQTKSMLETIKNIPKKDNSDIEAKGIYEQMRSSISQEGKSPTIKSITHSIRDAGFNLSIMSRKYAVPIYLLLVMVNLILAGVLGSKSLKKRKIYTLSVISFTVLFTVIINIPLFVLYFQSNPMSEVFTADNVYNATFSFVFFLKQHSFTISTLVLVYGIVNIMLGKNDIPRKLLGRYLVKTAFVIFFVMQGLPIMVSFIL